jgi:hypothetical protein
MYEKVMAGVTNLMITGNSRIHTGVENLHGRERSKGALAHRDNYVREETPTIYIISEGDSVGNNEGTLTISTKGKSLRLKSASQDLIPHNLL